MKRPLKVLIAKVGLDGHDRGAIFVAKTLSEIGCEVIYTGLYQTPEKVAAAAVQEDVDVVGLSVLSGAHVALTGQVIAALKRYGAQGIRVVVGGVIFAEDLPKLHALGVDRVFPAYESSLGAVAEYFRELALAGGRRDESD